ncbi:MAG: hypothetical protein AB1449_06740 [Chloroflexota bacterium]
MKIVIDHDACQHGGAYADRCLAATVRHPLGHERYCTALVEDDGRAELTVVVIFDGQEHVAVVRSSAEAECFELPA